MKLLLKTSVFYNRYPKIPVWSVVSYDPGIECGILGSRHGVVFYDLGMGWYPTIPVWSVVVEVISGFLHSG